MWKDYFSFNKRQRSGIIVLLGIIALMIIWLIISNHISPANAKLDFSTFKPQADSTENDSAAKTNPAFSALTSDDSTKKEDGLIKLNTTRKAGLEKNSEIAPYAQAILDYRKKLGGFIGKRQLLEVPGIDSLHYRAICKYIFIDTAKIRRVNINKVSAKKLAKHPYLNESQAEAIVKYRKQNGDYKRVQDLLKHKIINRVTYYKIAPYLDID